MLRDILVEYGAPIAVSLTLAVGSMAYTNSIDIAVQQNETRNMVEVQRELVAEVRELRKVVYRIDGKLEDD